MFAIWLSAGLLPWLFFSNVLTGAMASLVGNANLILKVYFPRETLVDLERLVVAVHARRSR